MEIRKRHTNSLSILGLVLIIPMVTQTEAQTEKRSSSLQAMRVKNILVINKTQYKLYWRPIAEILVDGATKRELIGGRYVPQTRLINPGERVALFTQDVPYTLASIATPNSIRTILIEEVYFYDNQHNKISLGQQLRLAFDGTQKTGCGGYLTFLLNENGQLVSEYSVACP